jgi:chromosome segregation ATPase
MRRLGIALLCLTTACARTTFHGHVRAGEWEQAARAFAETPDLQDNASALRRAAYLHAHPDSATWDPERAADLLARARARRAATAADQRLELALRAYARAVEAQSLRIGALEATADSLTATAAQMEDERIRLQSALTRQTEEHDLVLQQLRRLEQDLRIRDAELAALRSELERLKAIDLAPPRPPLR